MHFNRSPAVVLVVVVVVVVVVVIAAVVPAALAGAASAAAAEVFEHQRQLPHLGAPTQHFWFAVNFVTMALYRIVFRLA